MITTVSLRLLRIPLRVPYKLAFGAVTHFDTILCEVAAGKRAGFGEATILTGYTSETIDESWRQALAIAEFLPGLSTSAGKGQIADRLTALPFTAAMLVTAIEMAEGHPALQVAAPASVPLLAGINATDHNGVAAEIDAALASGYQTLKIKIGFDVAHDLERVGFIQQHNRGRARLRIDANQGYDRDDGCRFASSVNPASIELLEQPCPADDWLALEAVAQASAVPLMLDESIYDDGDIEHAAQIGASFVKLKLMKSGSLDKLQRGLGLINKLGMRPVLGNGVASEIGCWMEACVASKQIGSAGEMNGFLRQAEPLALPQQIVKDGAMILTTDGPPLLNDAALNRVTLCSVRFGAVRDPGKAAI